MGVAQLGDAANTEITLKNQALLNVVNCANDNWARAISGSNLIHLASFMEHPPAG